MAGELWFAFRGDRMLVRDGGGQDGLARNPAMLGLDGVDLSYELACAAIQETVAVRIESP